MITTLTDMMMDSVFADARMSIQTEHTSRLETMYWSLYRRSDLEVAEVKRKEQI